MTGSFKSRQTIRQELIRLCSLHCLIFFCFIFLFTCVSRPSEVNLNWSNDRVTGLSVPRNLLRNVPNDSIKELLQVRLLNQSEPVSILGDFKLKDDVILFEPLVPFTRGLRYEVLIRNSKIAEIMVPEPDSTQAPELLSIYPTQDTVPVNLLKLYLHFSHPMRESQSLGYLTLIKNQRDTVSGAFLDLKPELWNKEGTILTLWLDPGRIKRGLQPNQKLGAPLVEGDHYTLIISDQWKDTQGGHLKKKFEKRFIVARRDSLSPLPAHWKIKNAVRGTRQPIELNFYEPLDYSLLNSTVSLSNENGSGVPGVIDLLDEERKLTFEPSAPWAPGRYTIQVETRLEDLAGNNLNRPFERDLKLQAAPEFSQKLITLTFNIPN